MTELSPFKESVPIEAPISVAVESSKAIFL